MPIHLWENHPLHLCFQIFAIRSWLHASWNQVLMQIAQVPIDLWCRKLTANEIPAIVLSTFSSENWKHTISIIFCKFLISLTYVLRFGDYSFCPISGQQDRGYGFKCFQFRICAKHKMYLYFQFSAVLLLIGYSPFELYEWKTQYTIHKYCTLLRFHK